MSLKSYTQPLPSKTTQRLVQVIEEELGNFALILVVGWDTSVRDQILEEVRSLLEQKNITLQILYWQAVSRAKPLLKALKEALRNTPDALAIVNMDSDLEPEDEERRPTLAMELNLAREEMARQFPFPWTIWLTPPALRSLAEHAPDFYDMRRTVIWVEKEHSKEAKEAVQLSFLAESQSADLHKAPSKLDTEYKRYLQEEIDTLEKEGLITKEAKSRYIYLITELTKALTGFSEAPLAKNLLSKALKICDDNYNLANLKALLGHVLSFLGQYEEALEATKKAVDIYRKLANKNPDTFLPYLVRSLETLGTVLLKVGDKEAAQKSFAEGIEIIKPFAEKYPQVFDSLILALENGLSKSKDSKSNK